MDMGVSRTELLVLAVLRMGIIVCWGLFLGPLFLETPIYDLQARSLQYRWPFMDSDAQGNSYQWYGSILLT